MFSAVYRYSTAKTGKYVKELSLKLTLAITENRIEQVCFLLSLLFRQMVNKLCFLFGPHCIISAYTQDYELKFSTQANFDTL